MRNILFITGFALVFLVRTAVADTVVLTDGTSMTGDVVKFDDNGLLLRSTGETYTNLPWARFSQDTLKQLAQNPKISPLVDPFIEPTESQRPPKPEIQVHPVSRLDRPAHPSLFGGLVKSSLGVFLLLVLYVANLYAAFEVAIIRARSAAQVIGLAAVLPVIAPIIFLALPMRVDAAPETAAGEAAPAAGPAAGGSTSADDIQIVSASWQKEEKKPEPQVFARGKFTFNKRFLETKFAGFIGELKGEGTAFTMEVKTARDQLAVERIAQVTATEVIFETVQRGQVTVPLADIQEIKLNPRAA